ncbi:MAG: hypothetical protein ACTSQY_10250 [Candidatus Odinarchaeia archaeon]
MGIFARIKRWFQRGKKEEPPPVKKETYEKPKTISEKPQVIKTTKEVQKTKGTTTKTIAKQKPVIEKSTTIQKTTKPKKAIKPQAKQVKTKPEIEKTVAKPPVIRKATPVTAVSKTEVKSEIKLLKKEFEQLNNEKEQLKQDIAELDRKYAIGELTAIQRDQLFREKMVRAAQIAQKIYEVKSRSAQLGIPLE